MASMVGQGFGLLYCTCRQLHALVRRQVESDAAPLAVPDDPQSENFLDHDGMCTFTVTIRDNASTFR